jgi:polyhydroxyalkanoate synthesis regulator phasin
LHENPLRVAVNTNPITVIVKKEEIDCLEVPNEINPEAFHQEGFDDESESDTSNEPAAKQPKLIKKFGSRKDANKRKSYTVKEKLEVLDLLNFPFQGFNAVSRETAISSRSIRAWYSQKEELLAMLENGSEEDAERKRLKGCGLKPRYEDLEERVSDFVRQHIRKGSKVTDKLITAHAKRVRDEMIREIERSSETSNIDVKRKEKEHLQNFVASVSWFQRFMQRNNFVLRQKSTPTKKS